VITFFKYFYFCLKLRLNIAVMKQEKDIQNKLESIGTFEGEQTEIGTFFFNCFWF